MKPKVGWFLPLLSFVGLLLLWQPAAHAYRTLEAEKALARAASQQTMDTACLLDPIAEYFQYRRLSLALARYRQLARAADVPPSLLGLAAGVECLAGQYPQALADFQAAAALQPRDPFYALQLLALAARAGDEAAVQRLLSSGQLTSADLLPAVDALTRAGRLPEALEWSRWATRLNPSDPKVWAAWRSVGLAYETQKDWPAAYQVYTSALAAQGQDAVEVYRASFTFRAGLNLARQNQPDSQAEVLTDYTVALTVGDFFNVWDQSGVYENRAAWYRAHPKDSPPGAALADFRKAFEINPQSINALLSIGVIYQDDYKDLPRAEGIYRQAIRLFPTSEYGYYYLARVLSAQGRLDASVIAYRQALALKPGWQAASDQLAALQKKLQGSPAP